MFFQPLEAHFKITLSDGKTLGIDQGNFSGDIDGVREFIQEFVNDKNNTVTAKGFRGYGSVTVNRLNAEGKEETKLLNYNPYGIDVAMMLRLLKDCDVDVSRFESSAKPAAR